MVNGCREIADLVDGYVDGTLEPARRRDVDSHLASCRDCRALVEDVRRIVAAAATLEPLQPNSTVWARISETLREEVVPRSRRRNRVTIPLAVAAAFLLAIVGGRVILRKGSELTPRPGPGSAATAGGPEAPRSDADERLVQSIETELRLAEEHYEKAISGLEAVAKTEESAMDPALAATLRKNLAVIDQAIGESRAALRAQPDSRPAQESLFQAFQNKVALLQDTVALVNEMRKGNQAEAARIVGELNR